MGAVKIIIAKSCFGKWRRPVTCRTPQVWCCSNQLTGKCTMRTMKCNWQTSWRRCLAASRSWKMSLMSMVPKPNMVASFWDPTIPINVARFCKYDEILRLFIRQISADTAGWWIFEGWTHTLNPYQGFLHRLDVPSSGLILAAKSFRSYYDLQVPKLSFSKSPSQSGQHIMSTPCCVFVCYLLPWLRLLLLESAASAAVSRYSWWHDRFQEKLNCKSSFVDGVLLLSDLR